MTVSSLPAILLPSEKAVSHWRANRSADHGTSFLSIRHWSICSRVMGFISDRLGSFITCAAYRRASVFW